ncbi:40S ribosomal protein eS12 [Aspergillus undulatus]|uniref:40S ribosomal protein eS12 n=1 Tax=Aspergillus undulatus TaxID=1810928 RepID=UPI003CCCBE0C
MSDGEETQSNPPVAAEEVEVPAESGSGQMSVLDALKGVLRIALIHDGLARGLREAAKALDRRQAHMCVLNEGCEEEAYKKLVVALCSEHKIPLIKVPDGKMLGEWASSTARATPARSSTALALSSRTGVRRARSALFSSTTSRLSSRLLSPPMA